MAAESSPELNESQSLWKRGARTVALFVAGYLLLAGMVGGLESIGLAMGRVGLGLIGLLIDIVLLTALIVWLGRRSSPWATVLGPLVALLAVVLVFAVSDMVANELQGSFWSVGTLRLVTIQTMTVAVGALGMTMIIIAGGIDLSAGTAMALSATMLAMAVREGASMPAAIALCIGVGILCGMLNGVLISTLRVVPFIITLGTMSIFLGLGKYQGVVHTGLKSPKWLSSMVSEVPPDPEFLLWPVLPNLAWGVWLAAGLTLAAAFLLHLTVFGRHVFAVGSNESTARLCGVPVGRIKVAVYTLGGLFVGLAGVYQFSRMSVGDPTAGIGLELKIIAAVVIGGGSLEGGRGSIIGTLCGAAIMSVIGIGCTNLDIDDWFQPILVGVIIIVAVTLDRYRSAKTA